MIYFKTHKGMIKKAPKERNINSPLGIQKNDRTVLAGFLVQGIQKS